MGPRPARHEHRSRCEVDAGSRNPEELFLRLCFGRAVFCCLRSTERSIQQSAPTPVLERGRFACEVLQPEGCMRNRRLGHISQSDPAQSVRRCKAGRHRFVKGGKGAAQCFAFLPSRLANAPVIIRVMPLRARPMAASQFTPVCGRACASCTAGRPQPAAETGRSCWGRGQQDTSTAQGAKWMLGAATRRNFSYGSASAGPFLLYLAKYILT